MMSHSLCQQLEGQQGGDDAQQIEECVEEVRSLMEETDTVDEGTEDTMEPNEYSSGTTLEASDSTYTPEVSVTNEDIMDDVVQEDEDHPRVDESDVNSMDFTFNIANVYDTSQDISNK